MKDLTQQGKVVITLVKNNKANKTPEQAGTVMTSRTTDISPRQAAIVAGLGLLTMVIVGPFAFWVLDVRLIAPEDAAETAKNIMTNGLLFRSAIASNLIVCLCDALVAWGLYIFLRQANKSISLLAAMFRLMHATIYAGSVIFLFIILLLLSGADYLAVFETGQLHAMVLPLSKAFNYGYLIGQAFFALHLVAIGYLVLQSDDMPNILGILLMVGGAAGYLTDSAARLLFPDFAMIAYPGLGIGAMGEILLLIWLLLKGGRTPRKDLREL